MVKIKNEVCACCGINFKTFEYMEIEIIATIHASLKSRLKSEFIDKKKRPRLPICSYECFDEMEKGNMGSWFCIKPKE